jgi:ferritin-like metal-binding protein YciE
VRAKRIAIDNDLEVIRVRLRAADPRTADVRRWALSAAPIAGGAALLWLWAKRRRPVRSLRQLLGRGLVDLYRTERQIVPALERLSGRIANPELREAVVRYRVEAQAHSERLERVLRAVGARRSRGKSEAAAGLLAEAHRLAHTKAAAAVRDAWAVGLVRRIVHLKVAAYGAVTSYAEALGESDAALLLRQTVDEEQAADERFAQLGERFVAPQVAKAVGSA